MHIPSTVALLLLAVSIPAQDVDLGAVKKDLAHVFDRPPGRVDPAVVKTRFVEFFAKYEGVDLGPLSHARGLSHYWNRDMDKAIAAFDGYLAKYSPAKIESREQRMTIGRAYLSSSIQLARQKKLDEDRYVDMVRKFVRCYDALTPNILRYPTRDIDGKLAARVRVAMCREILAKDLSDEERDTILQSVYESAGGGGANPRAGRAAVARPASRARPTAPKTIASFSETAMSGRVIDLKAYRGQVVLVDFWATWCGPCLREMPNVVAAYEKHKGSGFAIIGVSLDDKDAEGKIAQTADRLGMTWEQIYDGQKWQAKLAKTNGIRSIPAAFLIDRSGKVRFSGSETRGRNLLANIELLLAEKPPIRRPQ